MVNLVVNNVGWGLLVWISVFAVWGWLCCLDLCGLRVALIWLFVFGLFDWIGGLWLCGYLWYCCFVAGFEFDCWFWFSMVRFCCLLFVCWLLCLGCLLLISVDCFCMVGGYLCWGLFLLFGLVCLLLWLVVGFIFVDTFAVFSGCFDCWLACFWIACCCVVVGGYCGFGVGFGCDCCSCVVVWLLLVGLWFGFWIDSWQLLIVLDIVCIVVCMHIVGFYYVACCFWVDVMLVVLCCCVGLFLWLLMFCGLHLRLLSLVFGVGLACCV